MVVDSDTVVEGSDEGSAVESAEVSNEVGLTVLPAPIPMGSKRVLRFESHLDDEEFEEHAAELRRKLEERIAKAREEAKELRGLRAVHFEALYETARKVIAASNGKCGVPWLTKHLVDSLSPTAETHGAMTQLVSDFIRTNSLKLSDKKTTDPTALFKTTKGPTGGVELNVG